MAVNTNTNEYRQIHHWIRYHYNKADHCDNPNCEHLSTKYEWALIKGFEYERNIENYMQLCIQCHRRYDDTQERRDKISTTLKGRIVSQETRNKIRIANIGKKVSIETKEKQKYAKLGIKLSDEHKTNISKSLKGKKQNHKIVKCLICGKEGRQCDISKHKKCKVL